MARQEIVVGLNNAVSRGESIEKAMQSMISAGYAPNDVKEASKYVNMGTVGKINAPEVSEIQSAYAQEQPEESQAPKYKKLPEISPEPQTAQSAQVQENPKAKDKRKKWIIILIILIGIIAIGIAAMMIFGESILSALFPKAA